MSVIKSMVRGTYDLQKLRIQTGNRIVANYKVKLGIEPGSKEETSSKWTQDLLRDLRQEYDKITDGILKLPTMKDFKGETLISEYTEFCLIAQYLELISWEDTHFKRLGTIMTQYSLWNNFLKDVKGVGPAIAGVILSEIDIYQAEYPTSLWRYAGLDVAEDGAGRSRRKEHLVDIEYKDSDGNIKIKKGITFNPFLKTKLIGVLGASFLRCGKDGYSQFYYNYKNRMENHPIHKEKTKLHIHNMSIRYMIKRFLVDLHKNWRALEGLPVPTEYSEGKLGMIHHNAKKYDIQNSNAA